MNSVLKLVGCYDDVLIGNCETRERNIERSETKGVNYCVICGKEIIDNENKSIHWIAGGDFFTEYMNSENDDEIGDGDMGWWYIGSTCYKKYKKLAKEQEVRV